MMRKWRALSGVMMIVLTAVPAWADWGPTRWNADIDATIDALGATASKVQGTPNQRVFDQDWRVQATGTFDGLAMTEEFYFDDKGGLTVIRLLPVNDKDCSTFITTAIKHYGKPISQTEKSLEIGGGLTARGLWWNDRDANLAIMLASLSRNDDGVITTCHLSYQPFGDGMAGQRDANGKTKRLN